MFKMNKINVYVKEMALLLFCSEKIFYQEPVKKTEQPKVRWNSKEPRSKKMVRQLYDTSSHLA